MRISDWSSDVCSSDLTKSISAKLRLHRPIKSPPGILRSINPLPMMERTVLFYDFHRQYRMPRAQNVLRLGQNRSLGPTGPNHGRAGAVAGHQLAGPSDRLRYRHNRHQRRCRNPTRRARRHQEKRKEVVMNDKLELDIPVLLPDLPDAADACLDRLVSTLSKREGVERAHGICLDGHTPAAPCPHFAPPQPDKRPGGKTG